MLGLHNRFDLEELILQKLEVKAVLADNVPVLRVVGLILLQLFYPLVHLLELIFGFLTRRRLLTCWLVEGILNFGEIFFVLEVFLKCLNFSLALILGMLSLEATVFLH